MKRATAEYDPHAVARSAGSNRIGLNWILGLAPQALCLHLLRRLRLKVDPLCEESFQALAVGFFHCGDEVGGDD